MHGRIAAVLVLVEITVVRLSGNLGRATKSIPGTNVMVVD